MRPRIEEEERRPLPGLPKFRMGRDRSELARSSAANLGNTIVFDMSLTLELDADCYPTEESLQAIAEWDGSARELLTAIAQIWNFRNWGWEEKTVPDEDRPGKKLRRYNISTAGWSGNESLIGAMQENTLFWMMSWVQSRRGGHYIFELPANEGSTERVLPAKDPAGEPLTRSPFRRTIE